MTLVSRHALGDGSLCTKAAHVPPECKAAATRHPQARFAYACCAVLCLQGKQAMRVLGFLQHAPDLSLAFLHRAGPFGRKYDPGEDEAKPLSHVLLQPRWGQGAVL